MTALKEKLLEEIARSGPIPVAEYMARCLYDPKLGYYATQPALGQDGDFITAPEISQAFGELLGLALAQAWMDQGCPNPFSLCELGPGNGKLMSDILRATKNVNGFHDALELHLIENSDVLRSKQNTPPAVFQCVNKFSTASFFAAYTTRLAASTQGVPRHCCSTSKQAAA